MVQTSMTLQDFQNTKWFLERPALIQEAISKVPPICHYKFKSSGKQCYIISYDEPESKLLEDVTLTVQKTGVGGVLAEMGMGQLDTNQVFGVKLDDLEKWADDINQLQGKIAEMQEVQTELVEEIKSVQSNTFGAEETVKALQELL